MMEKVLYVLLFLTGLIPLVPSVINKYKQQWKAWTEAQSYCRATGTDLATVQTDDDFIQLQNEAQTKGLSSSAWVGLYRDIDNWRWSLGDEPLGSVTAWAEGQPNFRTEECVLSISSGWEDISCDYAEPFICFNIYREMLSKLISYRAGLDYQRVIKVKQVVSMKVQSSQDVKNPAVKAALMEKIKQKLKEHGMDENIVVKWRGSVFRRNETVIL